MPAAAVSPAALTAIEQFLAKGRHELRQMAWADLQWLDSSEGYHAPPAEAQRRYTFLRLRFNAVLTQFDTFADVLTQRSENETGVWLSGLDVAAADALALPGYYEAPPVICYVDRGRGRRHSPGAPPARRRGEPSGDHPGTAVRMVGTGIASSLVHEVGHQGAALLDLMPSIRPILKGLQQSDAKQQIVWRMWDRWISEIVADFWAVAKVGVSGTLGLMGVVSLPRPFVFRVNLDDPHPMPWIRVKPGCAMGNASYPHPQWGRLAAMGRRRFTRHAGWMRGDSSSSLRWRKASRSFVTLLVNHRPRSLAGRTLGEVMTVADRQPCVWRRPIKPGAGARPTAHRARPSLAFAVIGQARADGLISPEAEGNTIAKLADGLGAAQHAGYIGALRDASDAAIQKDGGGAAARTKNECLLRRILRCKKRPCSRLLRRSK